MTEAKDGTHISTQDTFARDVREGLTSKPRFLLSRYFYDSRGDALFQKIMQLEEYYPTRCEFEILQTHREAILSYLAGHQPFEVVELGAGDGLKTRILISHFLQRQVDFRYMPIDISANVLQILKKTLNKNWPNLPVTCVEGEYFAALKKIEQLSDNKKLVLFLGSNIGNMKLSRSLSFLKQLYVQLAQGDYVLIGFDLKKDPNTILAAYNDKKGVTASFNLNLLNRINRELGGNFDTRNFMHWPAYNPLSGETKSYIISKKAQTVTIDSLDLEVRFDAWEAIETELSRKYDESEINELAEATGFEVVKNFYDKKNYFTDALWRVK